AIAAIGVFFVLSFMPQGDAIQADPGFKMFMKFFMLALCGIPFAASIWWLILFNRPRVVAAFKLQFPFAQTSWPMVDAHGFPIAEPSQTFAYSPAPSKPSSPVPILIVAGFLLFSAVVTPLFLLFPSRATAPIFLFGFTVSRAAGRIFLAIISIVNGILA